MHIAETMKRTERFYSPDLGKAPVDRHKTRTSTAKQRCYMGRLSTRRCAHVKNVFTGLRVQHPYRNARWQPLHHDCTAKRLHLQQLVHRWQPL
jgi:hypothetical protein